MFGFEDRLLLKLASVTNLFTANNMQERYWPVHVRVALSLQMNAHVLTSFLAGYRSW